MLSNNPGIIAYYVILTVFGYLVYWAVKSWLSQYQHSQEAWLKQTAEITTAFVEHTVKQSVMMEAVKLNLEQLNHIVIEQQKAQASATIKTLENINVVLKKHQDETERVNAKRDTILANICNHIAKSDCKFNENAGIEDIKDK